MKKDALKKAAAVALTTGMLLSGAACNGTTAQRNHNASAENSPTRDKTIVTVPTLPNTTTNSHYYGGGDWSDDLSRDQVNSAGLTKSANR